MEKTGFGETRLRFFSILLLAGSLLLAASEVAAAVGQARAGESVTFNSGRLSIKCRNLPVQNVLNEICRKTGISLFLVEAVPPHGLTLDMADVLPNEALGSILKGQSYAVIFFNPTRSRDNLGTGAGITSATGRKPNVTEIKQAAKWFSDRDGTEFGSTGQAVGNRRLPTGTPNGRVITSARQGPNTSPGTVFARNKTYPEDPAIGRVFIGQLATADSDLSGLYPAAATGGAATGGAATGNASGPDAGVSAGYPADDGAGNAWDPESSRQGLEYLIENLEKKIASGQSDREYAAWQPIRGTYVTHDRDLLEFYKQKLAEL